MKVQEFQDTLRSFIRRRPWVPYTIFLTDGGRIDVDVPNAVGFGGGAGGFVSADGEITFFECEQVREIVAATPETAG